MKARVAMWQSVRMLHLDDLSAAIRAAHLAVPLQSALTVGPDELTVDGRARMDESQFDVAPVCVDSEPVGVLYARDASDGVSVGEVMRPLVAALLVSDHAGLSDVMRRMVDEPFLFTVDGTGVTGFLTPADLGSIPVRTHFYLRLAHLERTLGAHLRDRYPSQEDAIALLSQPRRDCAARIAADLRGKDKFVDHISCVSLDDLVQVTGKSAHFRERVARAGVGWRKATSGLADFRNDIMHPTRSFAGTAEARPAKLVRWEERLGALIEAATALDPGCER